MNLFLLFAVPLAAVAVHRSVHPGTNPFASPKVWIIGSVWSILSLIIASFFGKWREFSGSLPGALGGLAFTDALLVPGMVVAAWYFTRKRADTWELGLWVAIVFTMAGIRDFAASSRVYDLTEYFLIPLDRILILILLPNLVAFTKTAVHTKNRWGWGAAVVGLLLTGAVFPVLSFAGWGWTVWVLTLGGIGGTLWLKKKAAPQGSGPTV